MEELKKQEIFEIEVLEKLKNWHLLDPLVFVGGTMLRLCYELNRYSVDLDFWFIKNVSVKNYFNKMEKLLKENYILTYAKNKFFTILFEIKSQNYPRSTT